MSKRFGQTFAVLAIGASLLGAGESFGATIVSDTFTAANGVFIPFSGFETGKSPSPINLPGGTYKLTGGGGGDGDYSTNRARMHNGGGVGLQLGTYNDNAALTLSADIFFQNTTAPVQTNGYALLGYYTAASTGQYQGALPKFTGLRLNLDGTLQLVVQGANTGSAIAFGGGTYNPATSQKLTFSVDTSTGAISGVSFGTSTSTYNFSIGATTGFTAARTELVGIGGTLNNSANHVVFDNFLLENVVVPEPATIGLIGAMVPLALRRRRQGETA